MGAGGEVRVLDAGDACPALSLVEGEGDARAIVWPGVGAALRSLHRIRLAPGARTVVQRHPMEAVYYVMGGDGTVLDPGAGGPGQPVAEGAMVHVEPGTAYQFQAGADGAEILGGPCPADPTLYRDL